MNLGCNKVNHVFISNPNKRFQFSRYRGLLFKQPIPTLATASLTEFSLMTVRLTQTAVFADISA